MNRSLVLAIATFLVLLLATTSPSYAGTGYQVTAKDGNMTVTYMVRFGGGRMFHQFTAYDPVSKEFVYLTWKRGEEAPKPASNIWDHETGRTIQLYNFPDVDHPLPVIPSMRDMKVCPKTGDTEFESEAVLAYD